MSTGKVLTSLVAGIAAGAVLGILFAPDKGSNTREKLSQKGTDVTDAIKNGFCELGNAIKSKYETIKEDAVELIDKGKEKINSVKDTVNNVKETAKANHSA
ncbi:MAG: YtxH domain-containing protein [Chitinophagaceae bacterium]|nr:YtxH domain-containing protein [Chitinophagaceae bacterium]